MVIPSLQSQRRRSSNNIFLHVHSSRIHPHSLRWNYTFGLGIMCLGLFAILFLTGLFLMIYYKPDTARAYFSIKDIIFVIPSGRFVRNIHRWAGHLMIIVAFLHMARVFYTGAYKRGQAFNWNIGIILFLLILSLGFTGYLLPWDQLAYWAGTIGFNIATSPAQLLDALGINAAGNLSAMLKHLLLGADQIGNEALVRFYVWHCLFLPVLIMVFIAIHLWRIRKQGGLARPDSVDQDRQPAPENNITVPAIPHAFHIEFTAVMFILALSVVMAFFMDAPLREPANPLVPENPAKAPWYFLSLQELVSYSAYSGGFGIPLLVLLGLFSIPYIDREPIGYGCWFGDSTGLRITFGSAAYGAICCTGILVLSIGFDTFSSWLAGGQQFFTHTINPSTLVILMFLAWSLWVYKNYRSTRLGVMALFTCFWVAVVVFTYFAWGHRGPNWEFYWVPFSWLH